MDPVNTAERIVETEVCEISAEQQAFVRFRQRVIDIDTEPPSNPSPIPVSQPAIVETSSNRIERVRNAFRETVMGVDHYDEHYRESLEEHAAAELTPEIAAGIQNTSTPFSQLFETALTTSIDEAIDRRGAVLEDLREEQTSLDTCRTKLVEALNMRIDSSTPMTHRRVTRDQVNGIARQRQETLHRRNLSICADYHDLNRYLYQEENWMYPVLTAIGRLGSAQNINKKYNIVGVNG